MQGEIKELLSSKWAEESKACRGVPLLTPSVVLSFLKPFSPRFLFILFLFPACAIHHRKDFLAPCADTAISVSSIRKETPASPLPCRQHQHRALTCCLQPLGMENMTSDSQDPNLQTGDDAGDSPTRSPILDKCNLAVPCYTAALSFQLWSKLQHP